MDYQVQDTLNWISTIPIVSVEVQNEIPGNNSTNRCAFGNRFRDSRFEIKLSVFSRQNRLDHLIKLETPFLFEIRVILIIVEKLRFQITDVNLHQPLLQHNRSRFYLSNDCKRSFFRLLNSRSFP